MAKGNTSSAVMQQRKPRADQELGPRGMPRALDYFPTPPWATRALCRFLVDQLGEELERLHCWEPACGEGHMARPLGEYFANVFATDVHRYNWQHALQDFLLPLPSPMPVDWVISNPPFVAAEQFIHRARAIARRGTAMLVRSAFTESEGRYPLFRDHPPAFILQYCERVVMLEQRLIRSGAPDPWNPKEGRGASSATSYSWLIWLNPTAMYRNPRWTDGETRHRWIPPSRKQLEREGDYPAYNLPRHGGGDHAQHGEGGLAAPATLFHQA